MKSSHRIAPALALILCLLAGVSQPVSADGSGKDHEFRKSEVEVKGKTLKALAENFLKQIENAAKQRDDAVEKAGGDEAERSEANDRYEAHISKIRQSYQEAIADLLKRKLKGDEAVPIALKLMEVCALNDDPEAAKLAMEDVVDAQKKLSTEELSKLQSGYVSAASKCTSAAHVKDAYLTAAEAMPTESVSEQADKLHFLRAGIQRLGLLRGDAEIDVLCDEILKLPVVQGNDATVETFQNLKREMGGPISHFSRKNLKGETINTKELKGKIVLIEFSQVHCPYCKRQLPHLKKLYEKYQDKGFELVGVMGGEPRNMIENYVEKEAIAWPIIEDGPDANQDWISDFFDVAEVPFFVMMDPDGNLMATSIGRHMPLNHADVELALRAYFKEHPEGTPAVQEAAADADSESKAEAEESGDDAKSDDAGSDQ